jgi:hypothetical protein
MNPTLERFLTVYGAELVIRPSDKSFGRQVMGILRARDFTIKVYALTFAHALEEIEQRLVARQEVAA